MKKLTNFSQLQKAVDDIPKLVHQDMKKDIWFSDRVGNNLTIIAIISLAICCFILPFL